MAGGRPDWLRSALGKDEAPRPPCLRSERVKSLIGRALLSPGSLDALEVQELAAAVLSHLVEHAEP